MIPIILIWLSTQQCMADESVAKSKIEYGIGTKITIQGSWYKEIAGGSDHFAPNIGASIFARYTPESSSQSRPAFRGKISYENSGNRRLGGMYDQRSEVKCTMIVLGMMGFPIRNVPSYYSGIESGLARWDIKATFDPLKNFKATKNVTTLFVGVEKRHYYIEIGWELVGFGENSVILPEDGYSLRITSVGSSYVFSTGFKF